MLQCFVRDKLLLVSAVLAMVAFSFFGLEAISMSLNPQSPGGRAEWFFSALKSDGMEGAVDLIHPESLELFKKTFLPVVEFEGLLSDDSKGLLHDAVYFGDFKNKSPGEMSPREFYIALARGFDRVGGGVRKMLKDSYPKALGDVDETPEWTHVVYRLWSEVDGKKSSKVGVLTLRRDGSQWKVWLTGEDALLPTLKQQTAR